MRLLTLTADYCGGSTWSGIGVAVAHQAAALASLGCEVHVISPAVVAGEVNDGPRFHTLNRNHFPLPVRRTDIVHLHSLSLSGLACEMKGRFGCRLVYTAHTLPARELPGTSAGQCWSVRQDRLFGCADHVFFLNTEDQAEAEARVPGLSRRSSLLPHGIPAHEVVARTTGDGKVAAFIGRFTRNKGIDVAAATAAGLIDRGTDWKFVFAGGHGDRAEEAMIRRLVCRYPAACHATGWLSRGALEELYSQTALVLMPSRYEPFGMVAIEAMSFGVPLLCSLALRPIVRPDSGGLIVDDHSPGTWIRACESLMQDSNARARLSVQGPEYVRRGFNSLEHARRFMHEIAA